MKTEVYHRTTLWNCFFSTDYRNVPKFLDRQVWANSVDPDQIASFGHITLWQSYLVRILG